MTILFCDPNGFLLSKEERIKILIERDGDYCFICKKEFSKNEKRTIDHWVPLSKGGKWDIHNLRLAHKKCNAWKGNRVPNKDGSIPDPEKKKKKEKVVRPSVCNVCLSGRELKKNEICYSCGSGPQPIDYPRWAKRQIKECDHYNYFCFGCTVGFISRKPKYRLENYG